MISGKEALDRLRVGNGRFVAGEGGRGSGTSGARRDALVAGQEPFAIVLGCSDARVPPEIIFDQGLGDLFVVRVAGNVVAQPQIDSIEFAAEELGARLVVVLGHSWCGAVLATLEELGRGEGPSGAYGAILDRIWPTAEALSATELGRDPDALVRAVVRANIRASTHHLRHRSPALARLIEEDGLLVVGAEYALETGVVDWIDGIPDAGQERAEDRLAEAKMGRVLGGDRATAGAEKAARGDGLMEGGR